MGVPVRTAAACTAAARQPLTQLAPLPAAVDAKKGDPKPKPKPACVAGENGCKECEKNGKKCKLCDSTGDPAARGMYVDSKGKCQLCKDAACAKCKKGSGVCTACVPGQGRVKGNKCGVCGVGFAVQKNGKCKACPKFCGVSRAAPACGTAGRVATTCRAAASRARGKNKTRARMTRPARPRPHSSSAGLHQALQV